MMLWPRALLLLSLLWTSNAVADAECEKALKQGLLKTTVPFIKPSLAVDTKGLIQMSLSPQKGIKGRLTNWLSIPPLRPLFRIKTLEEVMSRLQAALRDPQQTEVPYFQKLINAFQLQSHFNEAALTKVPKEGPLLVTLNHPLSGLELLVVAAAIQRVRPDVKIVSSTFLSVTPGLQEHAIFVDPMGGISAQVHNEVKRTEIVAHLRQGGALIIAPAGAVSLKSKLSDTYAMDPNWKLGAAEFLAQAPDTQVLPVYVDGGVSQAFHIAKRVHDFAGTAMILREFANLVGSSIRFQIGLPIDNKVLRNFSSRRQLTNYLRAQTYMMADQSQSLGSAPVRNRKEDIADALPLAEIENELRDHQVIFDSSPENPEKGMKAFIARGREIPRTLLEIGRLREISFWQANEGTGLARDLDAFDPHYFHLIAWDKKLNQIVGAYRIGQTREILAEQGLKGLYTSHYFGLEKIVQNHLIDKVEVGRSFVLPEYQGRSLALPTLFFGLARFIAQTPEYNGFFGAVSISNHYKDTSKLLIMKWAEKYARSDLFGQVSSAHPPRFHSRLSESELDLLIEHAPSIQDLNALVAAVEGHPQARAPQLIPIYRDVGASFLAFDRDEAFNTVDGLIATDIRQAPALNRVRFMGEEAAQRFKEIWSLQD